VHLGPRAVLTGAGLEASAGRGPTTPNVVGTENRPNEVRSSHAAERSVGLKTVGVEEAKGCSYRTDNSCLPQINTSLGPDCVAHPLVSGKFSTRDPIAKRYAAERRARP
jgi:hypothetical protein